MKDKGGEGVNVQVSAQSGWSCDLQQKRGGEGLKMIPHSSFIDCTHMHRYLYLSSYILTCCMLDIFDILGMNEDKCYCSPVAYVRLSEIKIKMSI